MNFQDALSQARELASGRLVYGEPVERGDVVVVPAARVWGVGGGGGGEGSSPESGTGSGSGLGLTVSARPAGAWVIRGDSAEWKPALDTTSVVLRAQAVLIVVLLLLLRR
jgi:uncharacterized spore protein YtfJ